MSRTPGSQSLLPSTSSANKKAHTPVVQADESKKLRQALQSDTPEDKSHSAPGLDGSKIAELEWRLEILTGELDSTRHEVELKTTLIGERDSTIVSVIAEVAQLKQSEVEKTKEIAALLQEYAKLQRDSSSRIAEVQRRYDVVSKERDSALKEVRDSQIVVAEKEQTIADLRAKVEKLEGMDVTKTKQLRVERQEKEKLRRDYETLSSQNATLQECSDLQSKEIISLRHDLQKQEAQLAAQEHTITTVTTERDQARRENEVQAKLIATARQDAEELRQKFTIAWDEKADLQKRFDSQLIELDKLRQELSQIESIAKMPDTGSLTDHHIAQYVASALEEKKKELEKLRRDLVAATSLNNDLKKSQEALLSKVSALGDELTVKTSQHEGTIDALTIQVNQLKITCAEKIEELANANNRVRELQLEVTTLAANTAESTKVTSEVERWKDSYAAKQKELAIMSKELQRIQLDLNAASSRSVEDRRHYEKLSAELKFFREQYLGIQEFTTETEEWSAIQTGIIAEVKDYAAVIHITNDVDKWIGADAKRAELLAAELEKRNKENEELRHKLVTLVETRNVHENTATAVKDHAVVIQLTIDVDRWIGADAKRAEVLAAELEKRNKENEELRHKLITLRDIYINAPRIKHIFQTDTLEIKRQYEEQVILMKNRYDEESKALKTALDDSQTQLRGLQRVVLTADTYTEETIISMLKKLNAEVQQNTIFMAEGIVEEFQRTTEATKVQISAVSKSIGQTLAEYLTRMESDDAALYLSIAFQGYFSYCLCQFISSWTIEKGHNDFINNIYHQLQKSEVQAVSGRWRSLTRACISPTWRNDTNALTQRVVVELSDIVVVAGCAASTAAATSKISSFKEKVLSIISIAGQFSEMIGKVVSADFELMAPLPLQEFEGNTMEEDVDDYGQGSNTDGTAAGQTVLCSTQLGMTKRMQREQGKETLTVVKAKVALESLIEDSFSPRTEPPEYEVQSHVQYGVICALSVDATDEDHIRRKHLWERDPTGDCYVPGYFESKLRVGVNDHEEGEFRDPFSLIRSDPADFGMQTVRILCYRGGLSDPKWVDEDESSFSVFCTIQVDLREAVKDLVMKKDDSGQVYYHLDYDVVVSFGRTDQVHAELCWITGGGERRIPATVSYEG